MDDAAHDLWAVSGQGHAVEVLRSAVAHDEVGHAWAFLGPRGVGQEAAARALVAALNCPAAVDGRPCGVCSVCERCRRGAYAAYEEFRPSGAMHRVDDVRSRWLRAASLTPAEGRWKVLRICDADRMNESAANAFLKGLEEPAARTVWVLDVVDPDELPDTVLSRCQALRFSPWPLDALEVEAARRGVSDERDRRLVARVAAGSPAAVDRLARPGSEDEPAGLDDYRAHRDLLGRLLDEGPGHAVVAARALEDEAKRAAAAVKSQHAAHVEALTAQHGDELPKPLAKQLDEELSRRAREMRITALQAALDDVLLWLRDCLVVAASDEGVVNRDALAQARRDAETLGPRGLVAAVDLVLATREDLERNVQTTLALEALLLELSSLLLTRGAAAPRLSAPSSG